MLGNVLNRFSKKNKKLTHDEILFYFMHEFKTYPLAREFDVIPVCEDKKFLFFKWKKVKSYKIIQQGIPMSRMMKLMKSLVDLKRDEHINMLRNQKW